MLSWRFYIYDLISIRVKQICAKEFLCVEPLLLKENAWHITFVKLTVITGMIHGNIPNPTPWNQPFPNLYTSVQSIQPRQAAQLPRPEMASNKTHERFKQKIKLYCRHIQGGRSTIMEPILDIWTVNVLGCFEMLREKLYTCQWCIFHAYAMRLCTASYLLMYKNLHISYTYTYIWLYCLYRIGTVIKIMDRKQQSSILYPPTLNFGFPPS